jgi:hypothetical protein
MRQFSIGGAMVLVALLAGDCVLAREMAQFPVNSAFMEWCLLGILPMANILGIAMYRLVVPRRPESRPFWLGFACFGGAALIASSLLAWYFPQAVSYPVRATLYPIFVRLGSSDSLLPVFLAVAAALTLLPHVLIAIVGGLAVRRFGMAVPSADGPVMETSGGRG